MSEMNFLENVQLYSFSEAMTLEECNLETLVMIDEEWDAITEAAGYDNLSLFEAEILGLDEADAEKGSFVDRVKALGQSIVAFLKKAASYIMGYISKWLNAFNQYVNNIKSKIDSKATARINRGVEKLIKENKTVQLHGLMVSDIATVDKLVDYKALQDKLEKEYLNNLSVEAIASHMEEYKADKESFGDKARAILVGEAGEISANDFKPVIIKKLTGEEGPRTYRFEPSKLKSSVQTALVNIAFAKEQRKAAKDSYDNVKKVVNDEMKKITKLTSEARKYDKDQEGKDRAAYYGVKFAGDIYKAGIKAMAAANSAVLSVINADYRLNAQLAMRCLAAGGTELAEKKAAKKAAKEEAKPAEVAAESAEIEVQENVEVTSESVESIFGLDLI